MSATDSAEQIAKLAVAQHSTIAVAESLTGGQLTARLAAAPDAAGWLRGGVVAYATGVKRDVLRVTAGKVVSAACARQLAANVAELLQAEFAVATTGVGGPDPQDGEPPGTVWLGVHARGETDAVLLHLDGDPGEVCAGATDAALTLLLDRLRKAE